MKKIYSDIFKKTNLDILEKTNLTRIVLFEKCKIYDFENNGLKYWYNKNGTVIRIDNNDSSLDLLKYIGFKGESFLEAGYVYAPYIPNVITNSIFDFNPSENIISRYATKQINNNYYGLVVI